jgi:hypothetical protein
VKKTNRNGKDSKKVEIEDSNGLKISYDKNELSNNFPHLIEEISSKKKSLKIESINMDIEPEKEKTPQKTINLNLDELYNPGVVDFLRRCTNKEDAIDILEYLIVRKEITLEDYTK